MPTPDQNMLTPSKISVKPNVMPLVVPEYDFEARAVGYIRHGRR